MDRNLLLREFTMSVCKFKANKELIVIYMPNYNNNINYIKCFSNNCFLITSNEYLRILINNPTLYRVSYTYGKKVTSQFYIHPCKMIVKKTGGLHENFILPKDKSLKDICDSKDYIDI